MSDKIDKRLFLGLAIPKPVAQTLADWRKQRLTDYPAKAIAMNNFHITLAFLGQTNSVQEQKLIEQFNAQATQLEQPLSLSLNSLGLFRKPQVLYAKVTAQQDQLNLLQQAIAKRLSLIGINLEQRPFLAHISLYRKAKYPVSVQLPELSWQSHRFHLYHSVSSEQGVSYNIINTWRFSNGK